MSFPSNPSIGNTYSVDQRSWQWNGYAWEKYDTTPNEVYSINGITGAIGLSAGFGITLTVSGKTFTIATTIGGIAGATPTMGIGAPFGALVGGASGLVGGRVDFATGRNDEKYKKAKEDALKAAYAQELARLKADLPPTSDEAKRIKYSPEYRTTKAKVGRAKADVSLENAYGRLVAEALEKELVNRGITPYSQNVNDLLGYSIRTAKK